jgi:hypothetical protein
MLDSFTDSLLDNGVESNSNFDVKQSFLKEALQSSVMCDNEPLVSYLDYTTKLMKLVEPPCLLQDLTDTLKNYDSFSELDKIGNKHLMNSTST